MDPSIHSGPNIAPEGLGCFDPAQIYLLNVEDGRWVARTVTLDIRRLDLQSAWIGMRGADPGPHPLTGLAAASIPPVHGPKVIAAACQSIEAACHARDLNDRLERGLPTGTDQAPPSRYGQALRDRAERLWCALATAAIPHGIDGEKAWREAGHPLGSLALDLAVRAGPETVHVGRSARR